VNSIGSSGAGPLAGTDIVGHHLFHIGGIDHGIRDFLAKEFAIPLAKPVNGDLERSL
jgi:hypothetical protein